MDILRMRRARGPASSLSIVTVIVGSDGLLSNPLAGREGADDKIRRVSERWDNFCSWEGCTVSITVAEGGGCDARGDDGIGENDTRGEYGEELE